MIFHSGIKRKGMMKIDFVDTGWMPLMLLEISDDIAKIDGDMRMTS